MGPHPAMRTVSPAVMRAFCTALSDGVDWLDEGGFFEADVIGKRDDAAIGDPGHGFDVFSEAAAVGSEACGEAGGLVLLTLGEEAALAVETVSAGDVMEAHDAVAEFPFGDAAADGDDGASKFVAEDLRRRDVARGRFF